MGQSNMVGQGVIVHGVDDVPVPGVVMLNNADQWVDAIHPLHEERGVGLGRRFAVDVKAATGAREIGLVPLAVGGTYLARWERGGDLYAEALRQATIAKSRGTLSAVLWHQGEADAKDEPNASTYAARFDAMVADFRADIGIPDLPFIVGQLGAFYPASYKALVMTALETTPDRVAHTAFVSSDGLTNLDFAHFDRESQLIFGSRYATAYLDLVSA